MLLHRLLVVSLVAISILSPPAARGAVQPCIGGFAGPYPCNAVDLLAFLPMSALGGGDGSDIWGWTDSVTGREYALFGRSSGTSFVDISDPENPVYLGDLPSHTTSSIWRDVKTYANHAFIVSEATGHGVQVFDLTRLRNVPSPPVVFTEDAHYASVGRSHNIVINQDTGYAYVVGAGEGTTCSGGLHMIDISTPASPISAGCFSGDGYTSDGQCVVYDGPDADYQGREICFNCNEDTITIVDVTNKANPTQIARWGYAGVGYSTQGWLTEDQIYFLLTDELDETQFGHNTRTRVVDLSDLDQPFLSFFFDNPAIAAIDHDQYVAGRYAYQANYRAGLRILDLENIGNQQLAEVAYFDTYPQDNAASFNGAWGCYPFFGSGVVIVSGLGSSAESGLYILRPTALQTTDVAESPPTGIGVALRSAPNPFLLETTIQFDLAEASSDVRVEIFDAGGRKLRVLQDGPLPAGRHEAAWDGRNARGAAVAAGVYFYTLSVDDQKIGRKIVYLD